MTSWVLGSFAFLGHFLYKKSYESSNSTLGYFSKENETSDGTSMLVPAGTGYSEEMMRITGLISVMRVGTTDGRIRGCVWGR